MFNILLIRHCTVILLLVLSQLPFSATDLDPPRHAQVLLVLGDMRHLVPAFLFTTLVSGLDRLLIAKCCFHGMAGQGMA